jgi:hypothetical protein
MIHVVDIQVDRWSSEQNASFTMNLGVCVERVWRIVWDEPLPAPVKEVDCFPRWRIGDVMMGRPGDVWWTVETSADLERTGSELREVLKEKCIPFMDKLTSLEAVVAAASAPMLRRHPAGLLGYAILKHLTGGVAEAAQLLNALLADPKGEAWHERVRGIVERLTASQ